MLKKSKCIIPLSLLLILTGCTAPGSSITFDNKNVISEPSLKAMSEAERKQVPVEQVNVYPLSNSFVAGYAKQHQSTLVKTRVNEQLDNSIANYEYLIGKGDILNITVWDHPELTIPAGSYRSAEEAGHWVQPNGKIFYPYIGFVTVADKTVAQVRADISKRIAKYVEDPQVDVNVAAFRSQNAYVTGEVNNTGKQSINNIPLTLLDAINNAGGITEDADWRNVTLTQQGETETLSLYQLMQLGDLTQNRLIKKGDIIHVPRNDEQKVFVLGDVQNPEMLKIDRAGMSLTEALSSVGGINELSADATGVFVIRSAARDAQNEAFLKEKRDNSKKNHNKKLETNGRPEVIVANIYQLNIKDAAGLVIGTDFKLEPYDVVYVTASPIEKYNRVIAKIVPTISAVNELTEAALRIRNW